MAAVAIETSASLARVVTVLRALVVTSPRVATVLRALVVPPPRVVTVLRALVVTPSVAPPSVALAVAFVRSVVAVPATTFAVFQSLMAVGIGVTVP